MTFDDHMNMIREKLKQLLDLLRSGQENYPAKQIEDALSGSDDDLTAYITSNELWGGAGSIADQALLNDQEKRKQLEAILIELGKLQIKKGVVNVRTEMWTSAFRKCKKT